MRRRYPRVSLLYAVPGGYCRITAGRVEVIRWNDTPNTDDDIVADWR